MSYSKHCLPSRSYGSVVGQFSCFMQWKKELSRHQDAAEQQQSSLYWLPLDGEGWWLQIDIHSSTCHSLLLLINTFFFCWTVFFLLLYTTDGCRLLNIQTCIGIVGISYSLGLKASNLLLVMPQNMNFVCSTARSRDHHVRREKWSYYHILCLRDSSLVTLLDFVVIDSNKRAEPLLLWEGGSASH